MSNPQNIQTSENINNDNVPKMLIIKLINGGEVNGKFNIYIRQAPGEEIINTNFI